MAEVERTGRRRRVPVPRLGDFVRNRQRKLGKKSLSRATKTRSFARLVALVVAPRAPSAP